MLKSEITGLISSGAGLDINEGDNNLDTSISYPSLTGNIFNLTSSPIHNIDLKYELSNGDVITDSLEYNIEPGGSTAFSYPKILYSGILTLSTPDVENSSILEVYCNATVDNPYAPGKEINVGDYNIQEEEPRMEQTVRLRAIEYGETELFAANDYVDVYKLINAEGGSYYQKRLELNESGTCKVPSGTRIRVACKPYGLTFESFEGRDPVYINLDNYIVTKGLDARLNVPSYSDFTQIPGTDDYSITATLKRFNPVLQKYDDEPYVATINTQEPNKYGVIEKEIIERPSVGVKGLANLKANFADTQYFVTQELENVELAALPSGPHVCKYGEFQTALKGSMEKLPSDTGTYYLDGDVTVNDMATIQSGKTVKLCLNGYSIKMSSNNLVDELNGENASKTKTFYCNQGNLYIYDCHDKDEVCRHYFDVGTEGV